MRSPALGRGLLTSAALHAAALGAALTLPRSAPRPAQPQAFRVALVAAPAAAGPPRVGAGAEAGAGRPLVAPGPGSPTVLHATAVHTAPPSGAKGPDAPRPSAPKHLAAPRPAPPAASHAAAAAAATPHAPPPHATTPSAPPHAAAAHVAAVTPAPKPAARPAAKPPAVAHPAAPDAKAPAKVANAKATAAKPATTPAKPAAEKVIAGKVAAAAPAKVAGASGPVGKTTSHAASAASSGSVKSGAPPTAASGGEHAGHGATSGRAAGAPNARGHDAADVHVVGLAFPYPGYLDNLVRQVRLRFEPAQARAGLRADLTFVVARDGSVSGLRVVHGSGNYAFDLEAQGAVEAAGAARAFGPLPDGFSGHALPVTFSFDPRTAQ